MIGNDANRIVWMVFSVLFYNSIIFINAIWTNIKSLVAIGLTLTAILKIIHQYKALLLERV